MEKTREEAIVSLKAARQYLKLGQLKLAIFEIEKVLSSVEEPSLLALAWEQKGNVYGRNGELDKANQAYLKSLELDRSLSTLNNLLILLQKQVQTAQLKANSSREGRESIRYQSLGNKYRNLATKYARQALSLARTGESPSAIRTLIELNKLSFPISVKDLARGRKILDTVEPSRNKIFLMINWAKLDVEKADRWLVRGYQTAQNIGDVYASSYILLEMGLFAERSGEISQALKYAQSAQLQAQSQAASDCLYQAYWLAGRIYQKQGQTDSAISAYRQAIASLDVLDRNSLNIDIERRIDFQNSVEPIYYQLLTLLLEENNIQQTNLEEAISIQEKLQLARLQTYFGDNCFRIRNELVSSQDILQEQDAVLLTSIILDRRTHFILKLPDGKLFHHRINLTRQEIEDLAVRWSFNLQQSNTRRFLNQSRIFYDWIVKPFHSQLAKADPDTLIFVHDGLLRNLPMAALYDGEKFLAQKWASIYSLGLNIKSTRQNLAQTAVFGLAESRNGWSALNNVEEEVQEIVDLTDGKGFLNREFIQENFARELAREEYSIVHLATHAYFGGVRENSFILAYDRPLFASDLENFLIQSKGNIELLVLSACETSLSSDLSILGLAGVAIRSGVNSVLGSFWLIQDDEQTELMKAFYSNLKEAKLDKAIALQQAQQKQIELQAHPSGWAALNLIGSP